MGHEDRRGGGERAARLRTWHGEEGHERQSSARHVLRRWHRSSARAASVHEAEGLLCSSARVSTKHGAVFMRERDLAHFFFHAPRSRGSGGRFPKAAVLVTTGNLLSGKLLMSDPGLDHVARRTLGLYEKK